MTHRIDVSRLSRPEVTGLVLTLDETHQALLADLEATGWTVTADASDPAWRITRLMAGREVLLRRAVADAVAQTSLAFATGANLDHIGLTYYALARKAGEEDADYRHRLADAPELYAVGLSGPWYESSARQVPGVADARATTPAPGQVTLFVQSTDAFVPDSNTPRWPDGIPDAALLAAVEDVVRADETRQQTDVVTVSPCTRRRFDATVTLTLLAEPERERVTADARAALTAFAASVSHLGSTIDRDLLAAAVVDLSAVSGATVALADVDAQGTATPANSITAADSEALLARTLTVDAA